ncbi:MAG: DUF5668 domain-containing protein [Ignavibacteriales bacterium]
MAGKKFFEIRTVIGIVVLILGFLLLFQNFDLLGFNISNYIFHWYSVMILIGVIMLFTSSNLTTGLILITIGIIGYMPELWPLVLVALGLYIILRAKNNTSKNSDTTGKRKFEKDSLELDEVAIFGGGKKTFRTNNFLGGKITTIFGGLEINLQECKLAEGEINLEMFAMFGGSTIYLPSEWKVELDVISIFGGYSDSRKFISEEKESSGKILKIKGLVLFGGGEIKN